MPHSIVFICILRQLPFLIIGSTIHKHHEKTCAMKIKSVTIPIVDQDRALEFYTEKLGFTVKVDVPMPDTTVRWIELVKPGSELELVLFTHPDFKDMIGKNMNVLYEVDNVSKTYEELKAKGVEFLAEPKEEFWGSFVIMKDSEGNMFCVAQPKKQ